MSMSKCVGYLEQFGYLRPQDHRSGQLRSQGSLEDAIRSFQSMANISVTGKMDRKTSEMMMSPRCGVSDKIGSGSRSKRYALQGSKWRRKTINYRIANFPTRLDRSTVHREITKALNLWSRVTPLIFKEVTSGKIHMNISFVKNDHGDGNPFDGPGYVLAHAFFPQYGGTTHFDDDEPWSTESGNGVNLLQVATHELGHALGLSHSDVEMSLMSPFYKAAMEDFTLHPDDVLAIQELYGDENSDKLTTPSPQTAMTMPPVLPPDHICSDPRVDAATTTSYGKTYFFKGENYYKMLDTGISPGYPKPISRGWKGVTGPIDAALSWNSGVIFLFKGSKYWKFANGRAVAGYPKYIKSGFRVPPPVTGAFRWSQNGKTYLLQGSRYRIYERYRSYRQGIHQVYHTTHKWRGIPGGVDDVFRYKNGRLYFIKDDRFYRYDDRNDVIDDGYPKDLKRIWLGCDGLTPTKDKVTKERYNKAMLPDYVIHERMVTVAPPTMKPLKPNSASHCTFVHPLVGVVSGFVTILFSSRYFPRVLC